MKYSELISFNPIEDIIQLTSSGDANKAREYVKTYVMSDTMAENMDLLVKQMKDNQETQNKTE